MVVVEGVSRTLNPHINIWSVARPIVERYISENIGPRAFVRDLSKTARVLSRFGPRLPELAEAALTREANRADARTEPPREKRGLWIAFGAAIGLVGFFIGRMF
jgi:ubiquinone biosynthesis protein